MSAITCECHRHNTSVLFFILVLLTVIALPIITMIPPSEHAIEKHADDALAVKERLDKNGPDEVWWSPSRDKLLYLVWWYEDRWGGRIIGATSHVEVTCFIAPRKYWDKCIREDGYQRVK